MSTCGLRGCAAAILPAGAPEVAERGGARERPPKQGQVVEDRGIEFHEVPLPSSGGAATPDLAAPTHRNPAFRGYQPRCRRDTSCWVDVEVEMGCRAHQACRSAETMAGADPSPVVELLERRRLSGAEPGLVDAAELAPSGPAGSSRMISLRARGSSCRASSTFLGADRVLGFDPRGRRLRYCAGLTRGPQAGPHARWVSRSASGRA